MNEQNQNTTASLTDIHTFNMLMFNIILRHDDRLRLDTIEVIRKILQNSDDPHISPSVQELLRQLRDALLEPPNQEVVAKMAKPSIHLVDRKKETP
ncbi:MAG: hypothetical protein KJ882_01135 [Proteobacteria bacterium]|nr:hypothetical protein [Pseudomonadota bacterium]